MRSENSSLHLFFLKENSSLINFIDVDYEFLDFPALLIPSFCSVLLVLVDYLLIRRSQCFDSSCTINRHVETCREALAAALRGVRLRKPNVMNVM